MTLEMPRRGFMTRIWGLLFSPTKAWGPIAVEPPSPFGLCIHHVLPLAAITPIAKLINCLAIFGFADFGSNLIAALFAYAFALTSVLALALVAAKLARSFDGDDRFDHALALVAYAATPAWLAGIFRIVPELNTLSVLASLYSLYVLYVGARLLLAIEDGAPSYAGLIGFLTLLLVFVFKLLLAMLCGPSAVGMI